MPANASLEGEKRRILLFNNKKKWEKRKPDVSLTSANSRKSAVLLLAGICEDACFFGLIGFNNGCDEVLTELFSEDGVNLCGDHAALLVGFHGRWVCFETLTDDVGLDASGGVFNELWVGVDGLAEEGVALGSEFCRQVFKLLFFRLSQRVSLGSFGVRGLDSSLGWLL